MKDYDVKGQACPHCGHKLTAASAFKGGDAYPKQGDLTICLYCAVILRFVRDRDLEIVPLDDIREIVEKYPEQAVDLARAWYATKQRLTTAPTNIH